MPLDPSAFGIGQTPEEQTQQQQRRRMPRGGLAALASGSSDSSDDLSKAPLGEGALSSPIATPGLGNEADEPSLLATERVQRAPVQFSAQPLLGAEDRAGAAFGEADRGEEGVLGGGTKAGLSTSARNKALMGFFRPQQAAEQPTQTAGAADTGPDAAALAKGATNVVRQGLRANRSLNQPEPYTGNSDLFGPTPGASNLNYEQRLRDMGVDSPDGVSQWELHGGDEPQPDGFPQTAPGAGSSLFNMRNVGSGLGLLGSGLGLAGSALKDRDLALAGGATGVAGQGASFASAPSVAGGAGLVGAGLGLAGSATGNRDLSLAGNSLSALSSLYGLGSGLYGAAGMSLAPTLAGTVPEALSLLGSGVGAVGAGAGAGVAAGAGAGTAAGAGAGAGAAAGSGAGTAAGLGLGATAGLAGGVLALPGLVQAGLEAFAPDWLHPSHYEKTRTKEDFKGQTDIAKLGGLSDLVQANPQLLRAALNYDAGPIKTSFNGRTWADMSPEEFDNTMQALRDDPSRLSGITGDANAIPYIDDRNRGYFANEAADYTRNMIAQQLGVPYGFVPREDRIRDYHGLSTGGLNVADDRLSNLDEYSDGTPTGRLNPNANWQDAIAGLETRQQRGGDMYGLPTIEQAQAMLQQPQAPSLIDLWNNERLAGMGN